MESDTSMIIYIICGSSWQLKRISNYKLEKGSSLTFLDFDAEDLTENYIWELEFESENEDTLFTSLVVKDFSSISSDSTFLKLYNSNNAEIFNIHINGQTTSISDIAIEYIGTPARLELIAAKLNCILDLQLIKQ